MQKTLEKIEEKTFAAPDEVRKFEKGKVELVMVGGVIIGKATFEPGWKWSTSVKPIAKTKSCEAAHLGYLVSGTIRTRMDDGTEILAGPGDITSLPSGHDAWVVGNEPVVVVDWFGASNYAKG